MTWDVVHKFPVEKDTYQVPINYPDAGYDTIIALWFTDVFTSILAIEDALGYDIKGGYADLNERISGGLYSPRIVGDTPDFDDEDFTCDGGSHTLSLSGIIPVGTKAAVLTGMLWTEIEPEGMIFLAVGGGIGDQINVIGAPADICWIGGVSVIVPVNEDREISYIFETALVPDTRVSITGYFR